MKEANKKNEKKIVEDFIQISQMVEHRRQSVIRMWSYNEDSPVDKNQYTDFAVFIAC